MKLLSVAGVASGKVWTQRPSGSTPIGLRRVVHPLAQERATLIDPAKDDAIDLCSLRHLVGGTGHAQDIGVILGGIQGEALAIMARWVGQISGHRGCQPPLSSSKGPLVVP